MALAQPISTGFCKKSPTLTKEQEFLLKVKSGEIKTKNNQQVLENLKTVLGLNK